MVETVLGADSLLGGVVEELLQEVDAVVVEGGGHPLHVEAGPLGERRVPVLELGDAGPHRLVRGTQLAEYLKQLVDLRVSGEKGALGNHLWKEG